MIILHTLSEQLIFPLYAIDDKQQNQPVVD